MFFTQWLRLIIKKRRYCTAKDAEWILSAKYEPVLRTLSKLCERLHTEGAHVSHIRLDFSSRCRRADTQFGNLCFGSDIKQNVTYRILIILTVALQCLLTFYKLLLLKSQTNPGLLFLPLNHKDMKFNGFWNIKDDLRSQLCKMCDSCIAARAFCFSRCLCRMYLNSTLYYKPLSSSES